MRKWPPAGEVADSVLLQPGFLSVGPEKWTEHFACPYSGTRGSDSENKSDRVLSPYSGFLS